MPRSELRFSGFGGQGIILAGYITGKAASIHDGQHATLTQSYGPESRGGASAAMVIVSDEEILYPRLRQPDVQILMAQEAFERYAGDVKEGGIVLYDESLVDPQKAPSHADVYAIPATRLAEKEFGRAIFANTIMLGAFAAASPIISVEAMKASVESSVKKGTEETNLKAFDRGYEYFHELTAEAESA